MDRNCAHHELSTPTKFSRRDFLAKGAALAVLGGAGAFTGILDAPPVFASSKKPLANIALQLGWTKNVAYAGSFIADYRGYYRSHGVNVDILSGGPTVAAIPIVVSGKALVTITDAPTTAAAVASGADLKVIAAGDQINPACIMSLASKNIKTPQDLVGKKIGIAASDQAEWQGFLKVNKIAPDSVHTVPAGFDPAPVASGEWDGSLAYINNEPPQFKSEGYKMSLLRFQDWGLPSLAELYVVTGATLSNPAQRQLAAAFLAGEIQGWTAAVQDPTLATKLTIDQYAKGLGLTYKGEYDSALANVTVTVSPVTKQHTVLWMTPKQISQTLQTLALQGVKASADIFDTSLLPQAKALI